MIGKKDIASLAALAHVDIDDAHLALLQKDLEDILGYMDILGEVDTANVSATGHITGMENVPRQDEEHESLILPDVLVGAAPVKKGRWIKVAKIIERDAL